MKALPAPNSAHDQKGHVVPHFGYLDWTNSVVSLMMPLELHGADTGASSIMWPKKSCFILIWLSWPNKWNVTIDNTDGIMWHWHQHEWDHMTESYVTHCFRCLDLMSTVVLLTLPLANSCKSHDATYFDLLEVTNAMVLLMMPCLNHFTKMVSLTVPWLSCDDYSAANSITGYTLCNYLHLMKKMVPSII